jgi:hypothetical protein
MNCFVDEASISSEIGRIPDPNGMTSFWLMEV